MLLHNPGFTAVALIALALGIGANSAIFSVVNGILLRPLGYKDPARLVVLNHNYPKLDLKASVSAVGFNYYRDNAQSFEDMAAYLPWPANLTESGEPERLQGMRVSASFFPTLGISVARGRAILAEENQIGRERVVVLSDGLWRRRFGADPNIIGKTLTLNGEGYEVVGIAPVGFQFGRETGQPSELWVPLTFSTAQLQPARWRNEFLGVVALLRPSVSLQRAQAEMDTIAATVRRQYFKGSDSEDPSSWNLLLRPLGEVVVGDVRPALLVLLAAVGFVLLIACANVANLLLARAAVRQKEIAIRTALGANRLRVIRQLLSETVILSLGGGGLGLILGYWGLKLLLSLNQGNIPRADEIILDWRVLGFTLSVSLLTGILFGLAPALQSSKGDLHDTLKEGGRSGSAGSRRTVRSLLVIAEMALALVLLIGASLFIKSFARLQQVSPGFRPEGLLTMQLSLPNYKYGKPDQVDGFFQDVLARTSSLPGVQSAGVCSSVPMSGDRSSASFDIEGRVTAPGEMMPWGNLWLAGSSYFKTMGIPLIRGRYFDDRDNIDSPLAAIVDETLAKKYWPDQDPIGKRIDTGDRDQQKNIRWREVVGEVGHVKHKGLEGESPVQYYLPHRQALAANMFAGSMFLVVRTSGDPADMAGSVRQAIRSVDDSLPVFKVTTMERVVAESSAQRRFSTMLLAIFAAVAIVLAAVGLYGVMAYSVAQQTHDIGVRMALGAGRRKVMAAVIGQGLILSVIGISLGLAGAFAVTRLISNLLYGVGATDLLVFTVTPLLLTVEGLVACFLPARRATRVDPLVALRYE
jgi:putative ABC transport system permease protein